MGFLRVTTGILLLLVAQIIVAADSKEISFVKSIAAQIDYAERHQNAVWPGFHPAKTPAIIAFTDKDQAFFAEQTIANTYAINIKSSHLRSRKVSALPYPIYYLDGENPLGLEIDSDDQYWDIDGRRCFVKIVDSKMWASDPTVLNKFIAARAIEYMIKTAEVDLSALNDFNLKLNGFKEAKLLKLFYLEDNALVLSQQMDKNRAEVALQDAIAIHQYRQQLSTPQQRFNYSVVETAIGIPNFISLSSQNLTDRNFHKMSQRIGCVPLQSLLPSFALSKCALYSFPNFAASVYGRTLSKKLSSQSWKRDVVRQFKPISQVLVEYYDFSDEQVRAMTEQAMKNPDYHYDRIERLIDSILKADN